MRILYAIVIAVFSGIIFIESKAQSLSHSTIQGINWGDVSGVGVSFGLDRVFDSLEAWPSRSRPESSMVRNIDPSIWPSMQMGFYSSKDLQLLQPYTYGLNQKYIQDTIPDFTPIHSPKKASLLAIFLPGSGQIYNHKYWKAPIVYAGLGGSIYAIGYYRKQMHILNDSIASIFKNNKTPSAQLTANRDNKRNNRDVAILFLAGVYVLQILDASVDANFYKFNINQNIGFAIKANPSHALVFDCRF